jgi:hypothetical protein
VAVTITPTTATVDQGATQAFSAAVSGATDTSVAWAIQENAGGTISASGVYTAPTVAGTYHVLAASHADSTKQASATVTVPQVGVALDHKTANVSTGHTFQFAATVSGTVNKTATWSVQEANGGTVSTAGLYTAPAAAGTYHVTATSAADGTKTDTATVTVVAGVAVQIATAPSTSLDQGATFTFGATVTGTTNSSVNWSVVEPDGGTITSTGAYTAPAKAGTFHVKATSQADAVASDTFSVSVADVSMLVGPSPIPPMNPGDTLQLTAAVSGTVNKSVSWSVQEGLTGGTISASGLYTAPATDGTYHVVVTPTADATKSAALTLTVRSVAVTINPTNVSLATGKTKQFAADVTGSTNTAVTWSVAEGATGGSVTTSGLYTAPNTVGTYHVVATSVANPAKTATATVNVVAGVGVSVNPNTATIEWNATKQFTASVSNATNASVTWSIQEGAAGGAIDATGLYSAPAVSGTYHVAATSVEDPAKSDVATVTVVQPIAVAISPANASVEVGKTQQYTASVTGTSNTAVTWSIQEGTTGGTITAGGLYTAPTTPGTYHVIATSAADSAKSAKISVQVTAPSIVVTLDAHNAAIVTKGCWTFSASVAGTANTGVIYSVKEAGGGTITSGGVYTAPATAGTYHVRARSQADATRFDEAAITVSQVSVTISPSVITITKPSSSVAVAAAQAFTATVSGTANQGVTWTCSSGAINGGTFTSTAYQGAGNYTITAKSVADPSVTATATATVVIAAPVTISVTPSPVTLAPSATQQFTATVANGTPSTATWSVDEALGGTIDNTGLYTAPAAAGTYHVRAKSDADPTKFALVTVVVSSTGKSITISAPSGTSTIYENGYPKVFLNGYPSSYYLTATTTGLTNTSVTWSLQEGATAGTISTSGNYTCGATAGTYHVIATSVEDPTVTGVLNVVVGHIQLSATPNPAQVFTGSTLPISFSAVGYFSGNANLSIQETGDVGTLSSTSNVTSTTYTPGKTPGTYHIVATSTRDASSQLIIPVSVVDSGITISINPKTFTVEAGSKKQLNASISGTTNSACNWKVVETGGGSVGSSTSSAVIYGAPTTVGTYHVTVTSAADTSKVDTATVTVIAPTVRVAVAPSSIALPVGGSAKFTAYVTGVTGSSPNLKVNWALQEGAAGGAITDDGSALSGVYVAPMVPGTYTLIATSQANGTAVGTATISVSNASMVSVNLLPQEATIFTGASIALQAHLTGDANTGITWSAPDGGVVTNGVFTAPGATGIYRVIATSAADSGKAATATIKVVASTSIMPFIRPQRLSLMAANTFPFQGGVCGGPDPSITWTAPDGGNVNYQGMFTAPAAAGLFRVTATSLADSSLSASSVVNVMQQAYLNQWAWGPRLNLPASPATGLIYGSAVRLSNGLVLATGSNNTTAQLLDPSANGGDGLVVGNLAMNGKRQYTSGVLLADGRVLFAGGYDMGSYAPVKTAEVFDPSANAGAGGFTALSANLTIARTYHTATLLPNGKVLITGGMDGSYNYLKTAELFDPATGTFTATSGTMAVTRANHTATLLSNGKVLITGGGNGSLSADAELYNPVTDTFTSVAATMSAARNYHTATLLQDGRVLIAFGGSNTADVYDPAANAFTQVGATVLLPIIKHSATLLANGKILLVGGEASYCQLDSTYIFDPETGSFVDGPALKQSREAASLITLDDGSVLVVGGQGLAGYLSSCERYR